MTEWRNSAFVVVVPGVKYEEKPATSLPKTIFIIGSVWFSVSGSTVNLLVNFDRPLWVDECIKYSREFPPQKMENQAYSTGAYLAKEGHS